MLVLLQKSGDKHAAVYVPSVPRINDLTRPIFPLAPPEGSNPTYLRGIAEMPQIAYRLLAFYRPPFSGRSAAVPRGAH